MSKWFQSGVESQYKRQEDAFGYVKINNPEESTKEESGTYFDYDNDGVTPSVRIWSWNVNGIRARIKDE